MAPPASPRYLPAIFLLFVGSGCAALIYEIVWFQLLQLVIGSSALSMAVLLGTFMGGMCLGSLVLPKWIPPARHPLRVYACLELGIGLLGLGVLFAMPAVGQLYTSLVGHGMPGVVLRALVCVICLLPPTVLMGATLPAIARWIETTPRGIAWLGLFYGGNTAGAVIGCVLAGFYLLRVHDTVVATLCAVALNVVVALVAVVCSREVSHRSPAGASPVPEPSPAPPPPAAAPVYFVIALSGFCALAAEVIWARVLSLLLGATVYTFSIILAVFLTGLGIGSGVGAALARRMAQPRLALAACQLLLAAGIAWAAYLIASVLPSWPVAPELAAVPRAKFQFDLLRCAVAILPPALLWGASFPLALGGLAAPGQDGGRLVGRTYAANTLGAIAGAVLGGLLLIPMLGSQGAQRMLIVLAAVAGLVAWRPRTGRGWSAAAAAGVLAVSCAGWVPGLPWQLVAYGRQIATTDYGARALYLGEGMNSAVAVTETPGGARFFHVSGKTEASSIVKDMRLQRMLGHLPALFHPRPRSVLIVGCGAGVTAGTFVLHPSIERIVICDIEPLIPRVVATHFHEENHGVVKDPRVQIIHDDARHYIATTRETFDIITSDPIHPWVKGSAVLYSQEYFELCRQRLNPGGLLTQWVPLYESDRDVVRSEIATFLTVFPHGTIWANDDDGYGYDTVLLGQRDPLTIDVGALQRRIDQPDHGGVRAALLDLGLGTAIDLLSTYAGRLPDLNRWLAGAEINRDRSLRLQYLAGLQLESDQGASTYGEMLDLRTFPEEIFRGSPTEMARLRNVLRNLEP